MLMDMALNKQGILLRIQAAGNILCQLLQGSAPQIGGILPDGDGMQVRHKVKALIQIGPGAPVPDGPQVITQMQISAGLDTGEHSLLRLGSNNFTHLCHVPSLEM